MKLEIHLLQSFPPANLNRDENGMPKSTVFGGRPRARISSQCQKRAVRKFYQEHSDLKPELFADRSRSWMPELKALLIDAGKLDAQATVAAKLALEILGAKVDDAKKGRTSTILFLGKTEIAAIADVLTSNWGLLEPQLEKEKPEVPKELKKVIEKALIGNSKPGDVALFGRMMAALPTVNVDASVQMAHAIGVNVLQQEFDFFTAVDDLDTDDREDMGADHMGEVGYNSSTYYRYTVLDTVQLEKNLGSSEHSASVAKAFADAFVEAIPSGHQNSFAAHSRPALVFVTVRDNQPVSLVDAFEDPVRPKDGCSLLERAVQALDEHWQDISQMYGRQGIKYCATAVRSKLAGSINHLPKPEGTVEGILDKAIQLAFAGRS